VGAKTTRSRTKTYIKEHMPSKMHDFYIGAMESVIESISSINKHMEILTKNHTASISVEKLSMYIHVDLGYARKDGYCYTVILYDMIDQQVNETMILSHILVTSTVLYELKDQIKYIEVIIPRSNGTKDRRLIRVDKHLNKKGEYVDFCKTSVYNILKKYYIEDKQVTNWTNKCIRCPQESRCIGLRRIRKDFGGIAEQL